MINILTEQLLADGSCFEAPLEHLRIYMHDSNMSLEGQGNWFIVMYFAISSTSK